MREIRREAAMLCDEGVEPFRLSDRQVIRGSAIRTRKMHVAGFLGSVVFGAAFEMGVRQNADILEHRDRAIHRRGVHAGDARLHASCDDGRADVTTRDHDLGDDRATLRGHAKASGPQCFEDVVRFRARHGAEV